MQNLKEYRRLLKIVCLQLKEGKNNNYTFQVRLEHLKPHNLFKYQITKHKNEVIQLYQQLQNCIFDFDNPFSKGAFINITKPHMSSLDEINSSLKQCTQRIDVITHHSFISFFSIQLHYDDFVTCLKQQQGLKNNYQIQQESKKLEIQTKQRQNMYCTEKPWLKDQPTSTKHYDKQVNTQDYKKFKNNNQSEFNKMINIGYCQSQCNLMLNQTDILDFIHIRYYQNELLYVLQQSKKATKIKNFFKTMFSQNNSKFGFVSIHRKESGRYVKTQLTELLAEPLSIDYNCKTSMIYICTPVGLYVYLARVEKKLQQIQIFTYVQLSGTVDFANNSHKAELYLLKQGQGSHGQLHVYSVNREELAKTQYKYVSPSSICFEEHHSRLFVSDNEGIHIYLVSNILQIKRLHCVKLDSPFEKLVENHGYLLGISLKGFMTVIELKPPQKQQLISVTTNINLPQNSIKIAGSSKNKRLIITYFNNCVVFIDTIEGPFYSLKLKQSSAIQSVHSDKQTGQILALTKQGHLTILRLSDLIQ